MFSRLQIIYLAAETLRAVLLSDLRTGLRHLQTGGSRLLHPRPCTGHHAVQQYLTKSTNVFFFSILRPSLRDFLERKEEETPQNCDKNLQ